MSAARDELAEVIGGHGYDTGWRCSCGWTGICDEYDTHLADAILASPAFARLLDAARGDALRAAAKEAEERGDIGKDGGCEAWTWLRIRADRIADVPAAAEGERAHPEDYCHRCGGRNISWYTPGGAWDPVMRPDGESGKWSEIICPALLRRVGGRRDLGIAPDEGRRRAVDLC